MNDISDNIAVCNGANNATESKSCGTTEHCAGLCVTIQEHDLAQANYESDESHQPVQVNQIILPIQPHLYINMRVDFEDETEPISTILEEPGSHVKITETPSEIEKLYENILRSTSTEQTVTYTKDLNMDPKALFLKDCASDITRKMGLNVPILRMNSKNYCTMMQMNDGGMDYMSSLVLGGPRLWLLVTSDNEKLEKLAVELLKKAKREKPAELCNEWLPDCHTPLMHKRLAISPRQLRKAGIRFEIFAQYAGDIVYLKHHLLHQVVDVDLNVNETANAGNNMWLENAPKFDMCACNHEGVRALNLSPYRDILREHYLKARRNARTGRSQRR